MDFPRVIKYQQLVLVMVIVLITLGAVYGAPDSFDDDPSMVYPIVDEAKTHPVERKPLTSEIQGDENVVFHPIPFPGQVPHRITFNGYKSRTLGSIRGKTLPATVLEFCPITSRIHLPVF